MTLRRAGHADHEAVATLLRDLELPTDGVADWLDQFWVAEHEDRVVGVAGMERYGDAACFARLRWPPSGGAAESGGRSWTGSSTRAVPPVSGMSTS